MDIEAESSTPLWTTNSVSHVYRGVTSHTLDWSLSYTVLLRNDELMSNGLGAGFFALTLLAVLGGLALLGLLGAIVSYVFHRQTDRTPLLLRYLLVLIGVGALGVAGFGVLIMYDEAPIVAGMFTSIALLPFLIVSVYLARTTQLLRVDVGATAVMAWSPSFLLGMAAAFGALSGINSVFNLTPVESRQLGIAWLAFAIGGIVIIFGMISLSKWLRRVVGSKTGTRESA